MIKKMIIILIGLVIITVGIFIAVNYFTKKSISFNLIGSDYTVDITKDDEKIASIKSSSTMRLAEGVYEYTVHGDNYLATPTEFEVTKSTKEVQIVTEYSEEYKQKLLDKEEPLIKAALESKYPTIFSQFHVYSISLYLEEKWAGGILAQTVDRRSSPDYYRFVLEKKDNIWTVVIEPQIAIKASSYPSVPKEVIDSLYSENTKYKPY